MENNDNFLEEILNYLGYSKVSKKEEGEKCKIDLSGGADSNCCKDVNLDIINGFQDIDPVLYLIIGELIGNIIAGYVPFNVANSISNYLNLVGQIIETYAAQQNYFQDGPGRSYNPNYKNVANPFMSCQSKDNSSETSTNVNERLDAIEKSMTSLDEKVNNKINIITTLIEKIRDESGDS